MTRRQRVLDWLIDGCPSFGVPDQDILNTVKENDEIKKAARAILDDWFENTHGENERLVTAKDSEFGPYWSPAAAMINSEHIAKLRAALEGLE